MVRSELTKLMEETMREIYKLNQTKGKDYAGGGDALANFKRNGDHLGLSPQMVWAVYASKHWDAVMAYCKNGQTESEPIETRLHDIILYCFLLLGLRDEELKWVEEAQP